MILGTSGGLSTYDIGAKKFSTFTNEQGLEDVEIKSISKFIDISEAWIPNESDFDKAQKEIDENDLENNYKDPDDLYLEYQPIKPTWGD